MKATIVILLLAFTCAFCDKDSSSSTEEDLQEISKYVREKLNMTIVDDLIRLHEKVVQKCPDLEEKLDETADQTWDCIEKIELGSQTFCSLIRNNFMECSKPVRTLITNCLPEESKDLPIMGEKILLAIIDTACNSTVEQLLELFNPCWAEKEFSDFPACVDIKNAFTENRNKLPSKGLICSMLPKLKNCEKAHQEASCSNPITKKAYVQFHEAVEDATADECDALNKP